MSLPSLCEEVLRAPTYFGDAEGVIYNFDDIVFAARVLMGCPMAFLSLADETWRSSDDVSDDLRDEALEVVQQAKATRRIAVSSTASRFVAAMPIVLDEETLGAICVVDDGPHEPSADQCAGFEALARQAVALLTAKRLALRIAENEATISGAIEASLDALMVLDPVEEGGRIVDYRFVYANSRAGVYFESSPHRLIGRTVGEMSSRSHIERLLDSYSAVLRMGFPYEFEIVSDMPGMRGRWVRVQVVRAGKRIAVTKRDVHEQRLQTEEIERCGAELSEANARIESKRRRLQENQAALAAANARLELLATTDGLTGLLNVREFQRRLEAEIERSRRTNGPLSLAMADVDHFKRLNDEHGHPAGDEALRRVADVLRNAVRGTDSVARYGGEEFCVILPDTDASGGVEIAERMRMLVASQIFEPRAVTASFGVATWRPDMDFAALVKAADRALYASKAAGRDRTTHADSLTVLPSES